MQLKVGDKLAVTVARALTISLDKEFLAVMATNCACADRSGKRHARAGWRVQMIIPKMSPKG